MFFLKYTTISAIFILLSIVESYCSTADTTNNPSLSPSKFDLQVASQKQLSPKKTTPKDSNKKYLYTYIDRRHTHQESIKHIVGIFGVSIILYPITQWDNVKDKGSFSKYKSNFGKITFDQDSPFWNWFVHPISGSQLFLYYRANGYSKTSSLTMTFLSSALFEFFVEIYQEEASVQDLYQTPVLGSILGLGIENLSLYLINSGNILGKIIGHTINPSTLFWFYEGKIQLIPELNGKDGGKISFIMDY